MYRRKSCGLNDLFITDFTIDTVGNVFPDGPGEEEGLLLHDSDMSAKKMPGIILEVPAVQKKPALAVVIEAGKQIDQ